MLHPIRIVVRTTVALVIAAVLVVLIAWFALHSSIPLYEGEIHDSSLTDAVKVERDALGSVTIRAENRHDASWTLGFVHAQERYFEMDLLRRRAAGELAELFGDVALPADRAARVHRMRQRMRQTVDGFDDAQRRQLDAYTAGVNAGLAALRVRPLAYLLVRTTPAPWRNEDTLLVVAAMAFTLNDAGNKRELGFARMRAALPDSAYRFLTASGGSWDAPLAGAPLDWPDPPTSTELNLHGLDPALLQHADATTAHVPGSNSFAVNGALTGGAALIANDMHLDLRVPALWFRTRLIYPNPRRTGAMIDISGASLPGAPTMVVGSNGKVAWAFTNSYIDTTDWVRVMRDPAQANRYRSADGWAAIETHAETIHVKGGADVTLDVEETRWGPIAATDVDGTSLALAWTAHRAGAIDAGLQRLEQAETVDEAVATAQTSGLPPQNFVVGDRAGSIAWTIAGRVPKRIGGFDPSLPADWSLPATGWQGWLDPRDVPLIANPPWHRVWSANQRMVEGKALATLGDAGYDLGARAAQIRDSLRALERVTPADLLAIQLDDRALFLQRWKDLLELQLNRAAASPANEKLKQALADWDGHASVDSVAYRLVRAWRNEVIDTVLDGFAAAVRVKFADFTLPKLNQAEHAIWELIARRPAHLLPPGQADWDALLIACAERTASKLEAQDGGLAARSWGERNTARIDHPLSRALPGFLARMLDMPHEPLPGDSNMPRVQSPDFGASERFAVAPGDEAHGYFMMPGGQSGHPLSPYYGSGHADWVAGRPTPFLPGPAQHVLTLKPGP